MASIYRGWLLTPDEFDGFVSLARAIHGADPQPHGLRAAVLVRERIVELASHGDPVFRESTDERIASEGYRKLYIDALKHGDVVRVRGSNAKQIEVPAARSIARPLPGTSARYWQLVLFPEMSRDDVVQVAAGIVKQRAALGTSLTALGTVLKLFDRHPTARTIREACEAEGIDWRQIDFDDVAGGAAS